jgi:hypothetical protein
MRVRLFVEIEINEQQVVAGATAAAPNVPADQILAALPSSVMRVVQAVIQNALPAVETVGVANIPELIAPLVTPVRLPLPS